MTELDAIPVARLAGVTLSLRDYLLRSKQRRQLQPMLREAVIEAFLLQQAGAAGLSIGTAELQLASDALRQRHGLNSAEETIAWLGREGLSVYDFEAGLERELLIALLREQMTAPLIKDHFTLHKSRYDRVLLAQIVVARADLAQELLVQVRQDGRDFAELAHEHSLHKPSKERGGNLGVLLRYQLPAGAEIVFNAEEGEVLGPVTLSDGFHLFRIGSVFKAELDRSTVELIRHELFAVWLAERIGSAKLEFPLLESL